jgi:hypothetical protein
MNNRERTSAVLHYHSYDRLPVVHFGFWTETLERWCAEGHVSREEIEGLGDGNPKELALTRKLGFDFNWQSMWGGNANLLPLFERRVLEEMPDGLQKVMTLWGKIEMEKPGVSSIPSEVDHLLKDRRSWEEHYLPKLQDAEQRVDVVGLRRMAEGPARTDPLGLHCGSLYGAIRDWIGIVGLSYLQADDPGLYGEIIDTLGGLCYRVVERILAVSADFDFGHFWEDICFKNGPLVAPEVFRERVGPHYARITRLLNARGIDLVSLDCDGCIDTLVPIWLDNEVNTMFPIEVGTWGASLAPWRARYGKALRGVGGMDKRVFSRDRAAVDAEIRRLKPLVDLGGYIPCPDHRIAPDAKWDNVRHYAERMRATFG